ncbi:hypothetical protein BT69DRAFT_1362649 [Atractiella rhizophila]|nr:hypothetical protein BT69DRAFT_1362649 [Atractiella rhizophila]
MNSFAPELLSHILNYLPRHSLLQCTLVSRSFYQLSIPLLLHTITLDEWCLGVPSFYQLLLSSPTSRSLVRKLVVQADGLYDGCLEIVRLLDVRDLVVFMPGDGGRRDLSFPTRKGLRRLTFRNTLGPGKTRYARFFKIFPHLEDANETLRELNIVCATLDLEYLDDGSEEANFNHNLQILRLEGSLSDLETCEKVFGSSRSSLRILSVDDCLYRGDVSALWAFIRWFDEILEELKVHLTFPSGYFERRLHVDAFRSLRQYTIKENAADRWTTISRL